MILHGSLFSFWCGSGCGSEFYFDSDPATHKSDANLQPLIYRPPTAPFWASEFWLFCGYGSGFPKMMLIQYMRIRIRDSGMYSKNAHITVYYGITQRTIFTKCNRNYFKMIDWKKTYCYSILSNRRLMKEYKILHTFWSALPPLSSDLQHVAQVHEINESHQILVTALEEAFLLAALDSQFRLLVNSKPEEVDCFISKHEGLRCVSIVSEVAQHVVQPERK